MLHCQAFWAWVEAHSTSLTLFGAVVWTAFGGSVPENRPKTLDDWWDWFRDFVHTLGSVKPRPLSPKP